MSVDVDTASPVAMAANKDIYELDIYTSADTTRPKLLLYDFVKLKDCHSNNDITTSGTYGRQETVDAFVDSVLKGFPSSDLVSCTDANHIHKIIQTLIREK